MGVDLFGGMGGMRWSMWGIVNNGHVLVQMNGEVGDEVEGRMGEMRWSMLRILIIGHRAIAISDWTSGIGLFGL